jgi:diguanylate cyclase (GGDEF)-like protein
MDVDARTRRYDALNLIAQAVWIFDVDLRRIHWANRAALAVWCDTSLERLCMRDLGSDMSDAVATRLEQFRKDFISHDAVFVEQWTIYPVGRPVPLTVRISGHRLDDGRMAMLCEAGGSAIQEPESLRSVEALLHTAVMITLYGRDGRPLYRNPAARAAARTPDERFEDRVVDPQAHDALFDELARAGTATRTLLMRTHDGERWHEISARGCRDAVTGQDAVLISEADVSAIKHAESRARFLSLRDPLTCLANRSQVMRSFSESVEGIQDAGLQAALMFIDLDHFKDVNDTLGHAAGDALLVEVAYRLRRVVRETDLVARLGGDEFLILLVAQDVRAEVERTRQGILRSISEPLQIHDHEVRITPSIGVSLYPRDGTDVHTLLRNADLAMYTAKELGRNDLAYYDPRMSDAIRSRIALETDLRRALERGEIEVAYQPIVDVDSGRIVGAEALARWRHPERGMIPPGVFIPIAESTGLIRAIGSFVFRSAVRQQVAWRRGGDALHVSVNLSGRQLRLGELLPDLTAALEEAGGDPRFMQVEITESMLLGNDDAVLDVLHAVEALGLTIVLDDFGTGYSNLGYLQRFPIRELKIDRSFVQSIDSNRAVAEMIVSMCRLMRLSVVAEGVETAEQFAWVKAHAIERCQGYLFSEPLPANAFASLLSTQPFLVEA